MADDRPRLHALNARIATNEILPRQRRGYRPRPRRRLQGPHQRTKGHGMKSLLWKDYRINRLLLIFGFVVSVGPWVIAIARNLLVEWRGGEAWWAPGWVPGFWEDVSGISLGLSLFTFALLGGNA